MEFENLSTYSNSIFSRTGPRGFNGNVRCMNHGPCRITLSLLGAKGMNDRFQSKVPLFHSLRVGELDGLPNTLD